MRTIVKFLVVMITVGRSNGLGNTCDKDCLSNVMLSKSNLSRDSEKNLTVHSSLFEKVIKYDEWNQVIKQSNMTSDEQDLPHYVVPEISNYERGSNTEMC